MKHQILLFTLALCLVKTSMAQNNPSSTNSQNAAVVVNNSGEYLEAYADGYQDHYDVWTNGVLCGTYDVAFTMNWANGFGGTDLVHYLETGTEAPWWSPDFYEEFHTNVWPATGWPEALPVVDGIPLSYDDGNGEMIATHNASMGQQSCNSGFAQTWRYVWPAPYVGETVVKERFTENGQACLSLATGGEAGSTNVSLWRVSASATARKFIASSDGTDDPPPGWPTGTIAFTNITAGVFGQLDEDGYAYKLLPDNTNVDVTPYVAGEDYYTFTDPPGQVTLTDLTVVSNSAVLVGGTNNWAAVKTPTNDWVYVRATLSATETNAAKQIVWSAGEVVPGDPFMVRVTKTNSAKTVVTATLGSTNKTVNVWILWSTISYQFSGINPSSLLFTNNGGFPDEELGVKLYLGAYWGKMCAVATITPADAHEVVSNGWFFGQTKMTRFYINGAVVGGSTYPNWAGDTTPATSSLDSNDKLYLIDSPSLPTLNGAASNESYQNFRNYVTWGTQLCCDTNYFWHWAARQKTSVDLTDLGAGTISIPTTTYYP